MIAADYKCFSFNDLARAYRQSTNDDYPAVVESLMAMELDVAIEAAENEGLSPREERG